MVTLILRVNYIDVHRYRNVCNCMDSVWIEQEIRNRNTSLTQNDLQLEYEYPLN
jgi:hypothetical protein